ncbi:MAG: hypothetical protein JST75_03740 [Bacteroidetes bacterium]|nr:hypothetical protein [Bacteroidota bacterium]
MQKSNLNSGASEKKQKFDKHCNVGLTIPAPFLLLCKLMDVQPETLLNDFMDNLSCASRNRDSRDYAKEKLIDYFIEHGYGQHYYSVQDIRQMFREMDAVGLLFPKDGDDEMIDIYSAWREKNYEYWFNKWFIKPRRKY